MTPDPALSVHMVPVILVVDDQEANVRMLGQRLRQSGYEVVPALSGAEGLRLACSGPPDLVLLDMRMPAMTGFEVLQGLRKDPATCDVPVIFLTADGERDSLTAAFAAGAVDYIVKPFVVEELLGRVRTHIELKQSRDALRRVAAEKTQVAETVAHDLRNYFSNILFAADMLRDPELALASRLRLIEAIRTSADSGVLFLQAFLDQQSEAAEAVRTERLSALELLRQSAGLLERQAEAKAIRLNVQGPQDVLVNAQQAGALHVLQNLVSNAVKYSPIGSEVVLTATSFGTRGRLSVLDRGPGISKAEQARLFQRYVRLSTQPTQGETSTGLGLALAKQRARDAWRLVVQRSRGRRLDLHA